MFTLLRRQRRRLLTCGLLMATAFAAKMTLFLTFDPTLPGAANILLGTLACVIAALVGFGAGALFAAIVLLTVPRQRSSAELICVMAFVGLLIFPYFPDMTVIDGEGESGLGLWGLILLLVAAFTVNGVLNGTTLDRTRLRPDLRETHSFSLAVSPTEAWQFLVPGAAAPEAHWDPLLYSIAPHPGERGRYDVLYAHGMSLFEHREIHVLESDPPRHVRYEHSGEAAASGLAGNDGVMRIEIARGVAGGSVVTLNSLRTGLLPRVAWHLWLDDALADSGDFIQNRHTGAKDWSMTGQYRRQVGRDG